MNGPAKLGFTITYDDQSTKVVKVHISKDQSEVDGFIMAARAGKAVYPNSDINNINFDWAFYDQTTQYRADTGTCHWFYSS